jgi:hypothetical protein
MDEVAKRGRTLEKRELSKHQLAGVHRSKLIANRNFVLSQYAQPVTFSISQSPFHREHHYYRWLGFAMMANTALSQRSRVCYPSSLGLGANVS